LKIFQKLKKKSEQLHQKRTDQSFDHHLAVHHSLVEHIN